MLLRFMTFAALRLLRNDVDDKVADVTLEKLCPKYRDFFFFFAIVRKINHGSKQSPLLKRQRRGAPGAAFIEFPPLYKHSTLTK